MDGEDVIRRFQEQRPRLRALAYRMLGSFPDAEDAVQEAWLRLRGSGPVDNLAGWLTRVVARLCLDALRARRSRREEPLAWHVPDPVVWPGEASDPEDEALRREAVGLALLVVLDRLRPPERVALVLHDVFSVPFEEIAEVVGRTPEAARQLASRARRAVRAAGPAEPDAARQSAGVAAFFAAARGGDLQELLAVLDPDVVLRADLGRGGCSAVARGAAAVAEGVRRFGAGVGHARPALVGGVPGAVALVGGRLLAVMGFTVRAGRIAEIFVLADPERLARLPRPAPASAGGARPEP
jgi:RNA polymerase sigma factor (sigma-70 family)